MKVTILQASQLMLLIPRDLKWNLLDQQLISSKLVLIIQPAWIHPFWCRYSLISEILNLVKMTVRKRPQLWHREVPGGWRVVSIRQGGKYPSYLNCIHIITFLSKLYQSLVRSVILLKSALVSKIVLKILPNKLYCPLLQLLYYLNFRNHHKSFLLFSWRKEICITRGCQGSHEHC